MKKGDIVLIEFPSANGHEQIGKRPAIVMAMTEAQISIVLPLTSNLQALRFPNTIEIKPSNTNGLTVISVVLLFQIRAIDVKRIHSKIGEVEEKTSSDIDAHLRRLLSL